MTRKERVGLVVDASYLYNAKTILGGNIDYGALRQVMSEKFGAITEAVVQCKDIPGQRSFFSALHAFGYGYKKMRDINVAGWLTSMAEIIMSVANRVDRLIVAVGDDRMAPILEFVENAIECDITLVGFADKTEKELLAFAGNEFVEIDASCQYVPAARKNQDSVSM